MTVIIKKVPRPRVKEKRKITTAYVVKMTFFYIILIVLGIVATMKLLHVLGKHI